MQVGWQKPLEREPFVGLLRKLVGESRKLQNAPAMNVQTPAVSIDGPGVRRAGKGVLVERSDTESSSDLSAKWIKL